jgi:hypothetical protein
VIELYRWDTGEVIYRSDAADLAHALIEAVRANTDLYRARLDGASLVGASLVGARLDGARLDGARLDGASLDGASLDGARLVGARLDGASLVGARLVGARLDGARLVGARLDGASLDGASLVGARLVGASLVGARLDGASLVGARLDGASLDTIRADVVAILESSPAEVPALLMAIRDGRFDGTHYEGECACLVGSIANARSCKYTELEGLRPDANRAAERWALAIRKGDTPATNPVAAITAGWIEKWLEARAGQVAP